LIVRSSLASSINSNSFRRISIWQVILTYSGVSFFIINRFRRDACFIIYILCLTRMNHSISRWIFEFFLIFFLTFLALYILINSFNFLVIFFEIFISPRVITNIAIFIRCIPMPFSVRIYFMP